MIEATGPNAEQIRYWNEVSGPKWAALGDIINEQIAPIGRETLERAALRAGERVLDVGCGCGHTSLELAERVGPTGRVSGIDISGPMLQVARERAGESGLENVDFLDADAQVHAFEPAGFDLSFSRFGVMFFADPSAAFANLLQALRPGGRLVFVCWQEVKRNPWMLVPVVAVAQHVALPPRPAPEEPGPFSFADDERVRAILERAGFSEIRFEALERSMNVAGGRDLDSTVDLLLQIGPAGALFARQRASRAAGRRKVDARGARAVPERPRNPHGVGGLDRVGPAA